MFAKADRIGIDAPFGWPKPFVTALTGRAKQNVWPRKSPRKSRHFADLALRATDKYLQGRQINPLSVSSDQIGATAMRAAYLLSRAPQGLAVDFSVATGHFLETYPAAALRQWTIETTKNRKSYKQDPGIRRSVVEQIIGQFPYLKELLPEPRPDPEELPDGWEHLTEEQKESLTLAALAITDHRVDALVSALVTLMAELDRRLSLSEGDRLIERIPPELEALAKMEGWIALPRSSSLSDLGVYVKELMSA